MSPIQLGTWAQLWILGLTAHSGGGLTLRTAEGVFRAQILPNAAWRIVGQRSGVSWEDQRSQFHVGQTPYGPGYSVQGTLSTGLFLAYLGPDVRWIQWTGLPGQVLRNASYSSQGLRLEGGWARWSFGIVPQGMSHLGWQGLQSQARWRFAPGRWEGQLQVYRAQITASGHPTWSSSRLRFAHRGRYLEFSEIHSKRGLVLQTMGRLPWRNHSLSFSIAPAPWPSWGGYQFRGRSGLTAQAQWSGEPMFRRWSMGIPFASNQGWLGVGQSWAGSHVEIRWKALQATYRPGQISLRMHHHWSWKPRTPPVENTLPLEAPTMHILTQGEIDHPVLPVYVIDSEGRNHALHLVRGSHQWKTHLAPGTYHWPALILRPEPGWIVEVMASTFTLEAGQTCHLPVLVRKDERPIYWLPISAVGATGESPNR